MRRVSPLHQFGNGSKTLPYLCIQDNGRDRHYVFAVKPKVEYGVARRLGSRVHRIKSAAGAIIDGRLNIGARWQCNAYSPDIDLVAGPAPATPLCHLCERASKPVVYRCFSANGGLLYVGHSGNVTRRLANHALYAQWWPEVADVRTESRGSSREAMAAEELAIHNEKPLYNLQDRAASHLGVRAAATT